jgi:hypothetical protein
MSATIPCTCLNDRDAMLREKGFKIAPNCRAMIMETTRIVHAYGLPIERLPDSRRKSSDPKMILISHCPFCGEKL